MDFVAPLIRHIAFPLWEKKNGTARLYHLRDFERGQFASPDEIRARQWTDFQSIVRHAFQSCPFYRRKFTAVGFEPGDLRSPEDIARLPTTSKQDIQEGGPDLMASGIRPADVIRDMTGGSTGRPMVVYYDQTRFDRRVAATIRHNRWAGWDIGDKVASVWGAPRDVGQTSSLTARLRTWVIDRQLMLDASAIDERKLREFAQRLVQYKPRAMIGYANALAMFARFVLAEGVNGIRPRGIVSSAEVLSPLSRSVIEQAFGCRVFDRYGSRELGIMASECEAHGGMHINAEDLFVEVLVDGAPRSEQTGDIVITDLRNRVMPMIRYQTMDVGKTLLSRCSCGRGLPLVELSGGRVTDFLVSASGAKVSGIVLATYVITNVDGIGQVQFVQLQRDVVTIRIVKGAGWTDRTLERLLDRTREFLGTSMTIEVEYVATIPVEASGKYRFSISSVS